MFGYGSASEMIGRDSHELVHHTHADGSPYAVEECPLFKAFHQGVAVHAENELLWRADGSSFRADCRSGPLMQNCRVIDAVVTFIDNTDRYELEQELLINRAWLRATLGEIGDAVFATDVSRPPRITFMNPVCEKLTGWASKEAIGKPVHEIFKILHSKTREPADDPIERVFSDLEVVGLAKHTVLVAKNGTEISIEDSAAPIMADNGKLQGVALVFRDVTQEVNSRQAIADSAKAVLDERGKLESMISESPIGIALTRGPDFKFERVNKNFTELVGEREYIGRKWVEVYPELADSELPRLLAEVFRTGKPFRIQDTPLIVRDKDGNLTQNYYSFTYDRIMSGDNLPYGVSIHTIRTTDAVHHRQRLAASEQRLSAAVEAACVGFYDWDIKKNIVVYRDQMRKVWDIGENSTLEEALKKVHPEDIEVLNAKIARTMTTGVRLRAEYRITRGDGSEIWIEAHCAVERDEDGLPFRFHETSVNISRAKYSSLAIAEARDEAERANQAKSDFLANMSHEIRTPLGAILGYSELSKDRSLSQEEHDQFLETISRNGVALTRIIDDILDLAKVESGKLDVERLDFSFMELIEDVVASFRENAKAKGIYLRTAINGDVPARIHSDPSRLRQILVNIVGNAIKFTEAGGVIVNISARDVSGRLLEIQIKVIDTGLGLSSEQLERLFQPFVQADSSTARRFGGTGLGLVLSQRLDNALGGEIAVEPNPERTGSVFMIKFLAGTAMTVKAQSSPRRLKGDAKYLQICPTALRGYRILFVDDAKDDRVLVKTLLVCCAAKVDLASNGIEAITMIKAGDYDVVLLDIQMPEMDGYDAITVLRSIGYKKPVIALTAHAMIEERVRTSAAGFNGHLTKPVDLPEMVAAIQQFSPKH